MLRSVKHVEVELKTYPPKDDEIEPNTITLALWDKKDFQLADRIIIYGDGNKIATVIAKDLKDAVFSIYRMT